ncbi:MAG: hypothetical protein Q8M01_19625 [Rubrivivax sp.]|nr:hypothetical protein [Rubrivivax sp.]
MALPYVVLDCPAYSRLSHPARALLLEVARQCKADDNGRLLLSRPHLAARGWKSADVIQRAKLELINAGFIFETVKGHRPNKASWYAITWHKLGKIAGFDPGADKAFEQGAYRRDVPLIQPKTLRGSQPKAPFQNTSLSPSNGQGKALIGPLDGQERPPPCPSNGPIRGVLTPSPCPSNGHPLDMPSAVAVQPTL